MRKLLACYTKSYVEIRAEFYREITNVTSLRFAKDALDKLSQTDIYFICSRLDVTYSEQHGFQQTFTSNHSHLKFYVSFEDDQKQRSFFPISIPLPNKNQFHIEIADRAGREIKIIGDGEEQLINLGLNPIVTQFYQHLVNQVRVHYIGSCKNDGLVHRTKNGHVGLEKTLNLASNQFKNRDVFLMAFNFKHGEFKIENSGVASVLEKTISRDLMIDIAEATLIGFFKPMYNNKLLEFPKGDEKMISKLIAHGCTDVHLLLEGQKELRLQNRSKNFDTFFCTDHVVNHIMRDFEISFDPQVCLPVGYRLESPVFPSSLESSKIILSLSHQRKESV